MATPRAFTIKYEKFSKTLETSCGVCKAFDSEYKTFYALWDTGATGSVISKDVVQELGLKSIGKEKVYHANGASIVNAYSNTIHARY